MKKYPSRYSPDKFVREDQYIIELVCENKAKSLGKDLPVKFWLLPEWSGFFRSQLRRCKGLIENYSSEAVIRALKETRCYSLHAKWLLPIINKHQLELNKTPIQKDLPKMEGSSFKRKEFNKKENKLDKLDS
jgi:hypothetical protein